MVGIGIIKKDEFNLGLKNGLVQIGRKLGLKREKSNPFGGRKNLWQKQPTI